VGVVVPANAGIHSHRHVSLHRLAPTARYNNEHRWLWVPAFARTTRGESVALIPVMRRRRCAPHAAFASAPINHNLGLSLRVTQS
jgi:hypothetical protein